MKPPSERILQLARAMGGALTLGALIGCGSDPVATVAKASTVAVNPAGGATAAVPANHSTNGFGSLLSVFHAGPDSGRDPFYPNAHRGPVKNSESASTRLPLLSYLKLVGIRSGTTRPMALINRTAFAPGEEGEVPIAVTNQLNKVEIHRINIRCVEVKLDSVLISIAGEEGIKELRMAQRK